MEATQFSSCAYDNLCQVLDSYEEEHIHLEVKFLNLALVTATLNDNHKCIGKLIKMGAKNIDDCIKLAREKGAISSTAKLLLMKAALTGDKPLLRCLVRTSPNIECVSLQIPTNKQAVSGAVLSGRVSTNDALEIAKQNGHHSVWRELLLLTKATQSDGRADWNRQGFINTVDVQLLETMRTWVKQLNLSSNMIESIPTEIGMLSMMTKIDLSYNLVTSIPASLLQHPNLKVLTLSNNKISHLPDVPLWSATLSEVDFSNNYLSSMPMNISASHLISLNLSGNQFSEVPLCVCTFTNLLSLDVSDNPNIKALPYEICWLTQLKHLNLNGLKRLKEPPIAFLHSLHQCRSYQKKKLFDYTRGLNCMQLMIVGKSSEAKNILASRLQGKDLKEHDGTQGRIQISEWEYRPNIGRQLFRFRVWIFKSLEDYAATHCSFLSQRSLYWSSTWNMEMKEYVS